MVKVIYNSGGRVPVDSNITIGKAIELVAGSSDLEHCVFFNDQKLDNSTLIGEIPGIQDDHTLRVIGVSKKDLTSKKPTTREITKAFGRLNDNELQKLSVFIDRADFKENLLKKLPALVNDSQLIGVLSDLQLTMAILQKNKTFSDEHPLFTSAIYAIFELTFNADVFNRLFSLNRTATSSSEMSEDNVRQLLNFLPAQTTAARTPATNIGQNNLITNDMFARAMQLLGGQGPSDTNTPAPIATEPEDLLQKYSAQLAQLHEYGFTNNDENILALTEANGSIEYALEIIIQNREQND